MIRRFPLPAKIFAWLFLNVALLAVAAWIFLQNQLRVGMDSLLMGAAGERIRSVANLIVDELNEEPRESWDATLAKFDAAYPVRFTVFSQHGPQLAGVKTDLPEEVRAVIARAPRPDPERPPRPGDDRPPRPLDDRPPRPAGEAPPDPLNPRPRPPAPRRNIEAFIRTSSPTRYWTLVHAPLPRLNREGPGLLVLESQTLGAGGLIFDFVPVVWAGGAVLILSVLFWLPLVRGITRSIGGMRDATVRIAEGHFDVRVDDSRRDELGALAAAINAMSERLASLVTGQKRFLGDIAHELCAPLSRLQMALGILEERTADTDRERIADVREEVDHMAGLVDELLLFSRASLGSSKTKLRVVSVREIIDGAVRREEVGKVQIEVVCPPALQASADPALLQRAIGNLLRNAIRYAGKAGPITVSASETDGDVIIEVKDRGPGVPEEDIQQLFDPFFRVDVSRTRETGGVGLGLTIARSCVEACRGSITIRNAKPAGLCASIRIGGVGRI